jgi:hypothetical protein
MALRINTAIKTKEGFDVPSGTFVIFNTIFPAQKLEVHYNMKFYRNETSYNDGEQNYIPSGLTSMGYIDYPTQGEFSSLTPITVHENLKDYLGTIWTGGTIDIVM